MNSALDLIEHFGRKTEIRWNIKHGAVPRDISYGKNNNGQLHTVIQ